MAERRSTPGLVTQSTTRSTTSTGTAGTIVGYAAVFNSVSTISDLFDEQIAPSAFDEALQREDDTRALLNHDPNFILGRTTAGTLRLSKTEHGLGYAIDLPSSFVGGHVAEAVRRGDINGSSFGFVVDDERWDDRRVKSGGLPLRTILSVKLLDVSPVAFPAYGATTVSARTSITDLEILRARIAKERLVRL